MNLSKKGTLQSRINQKGVSLLMSSLPVGKKFRMLFKEETNDFGIDGEFQFFIDENNTGEFYKVQIKSKKEGKYVNQGKYISLPIDLSSIHYMINVVTQPVALIVVDTKAKKVFWHPIQQDTDLRREYEKRLLDNNSTPESTINIKVDIKNILSKSNYKGLYNYFTDIKAMISKRNLLNIKTDKTLNEGFRLFKEGLDQTLELEGFDHIYRKGDLMTKGTMFSMMDHTGLIIDFVPNKNYRDELAPLINFKTKFSTKTEQEKYKKFKNLVETGEGIIDLTKENVDVFEIRTGNQLIDSNKFYSDLKITVSSPIIKNRQTISIFNGQNFLNLNVDTWVESGVINIESTREETLYIKVALKNNDSQGKFNILVRTEKISSLEQELKIGEFIQLLEKKFEIYIIDIDGFQRKLVEANLNESIPNGQERINFLNALYEIQQSTGKQIQYPIPDDIDMTDIRNIFWVHRFVKQGTIEEEVTANFTLDDKEKEFTVGHFVQFSFSPPDLYLFKKPFILTGYEQVVRGQISEVHKNNDGGYKIVIKKAQNILQEFKNHNS